MSTYEKGKAEAGKADQRDGDEVEAIDGNMVERRLVMPLMDSASKPTNPVCTEFASAVRLRQPRYKILSPTGPTIICQRLCTCCEDSNLFVPHAFAADWVKCMWIKYNPECPSLKEPD
jgi:hypothetical protein